MATIELSDGRVIPIVKPSIADQMLLERQMRGTQKKYGPTEFANDLKLGSFQQAFSLFASLNRAGVHPNIEEILELDMGQLSDMVKLEPGDDPDDSDDEGEGEQTPDPQPAPTGDADAA